MTKTMRILPFALLFAVGACQHLEPLGRDYGNAYNHNLSVQVIDPAPSFEGREVPDMNGERAAGAVDRYATGAVIAPEEVETTQ